MANYFFIDLTGQQFGRLKVLEKTNKRYGSFIIWKCKCDCGNIKFVPYILLVNGHTKSCGCYKKEISSKRLIKDLSGRIFNRWTVLEKTNERSCGKVLWKCRCKCGTEKLVSSINLTSGNSKSCGCYNKEMIFKKLRKNITGQQFGWLVALKSNGEHKQRSILWECKCKCGNIILVSSRALLSGNTRSCGCLQKSIVREIGRDPIIGMKKRETQRENVANGAHSKLKHGNRCRYLYY